MGDGMKKRNYINIATLIESRDSSTGKHVKRISKYVSLIVEEMRKKGYYRDTLTKKYANNLVKSAPLHDIGKLYVPDAILAKPDRLTAEEFEIMKLHAENGGEIILKLFANSGNKNYRYMAYQIARWHHEKWNGKGYPDGLMKDDIPLCAKIVAVADVFDAISENRCYRNAMPLDECFKIIENGAKKDFDPLVVKAFLNIQKKIKKAHKKFKENMQ